MAVARLHHYNLERPITRVMKVPRRPEQLDKWLKEAIKALGDQWPQEEMVLLVPPVVEIDQIVWSHTNGYELVVDRKASALGC